MNGLIPEAYAQAGAAPPGGQFAPLLMMLLFIVIFYFLLIRPQQKKAKEHQTMLSALATGDEVVTAGGIVGKVVAIGDGLVTLEVAPGVNLKVQKFQVSSLVPKGTLKG